MKPRCSKVPSGSGTSACAHPEIRANKSPKLGAHSGPAKAVCSCNVVVADTAAHESKKKPRRLKSDSFGLNRSGFPNRPGSVSRWLERRPASEGAMLSHRRYWVRWTRNHVVQLEGLRRAICWKVSGGQRSDHGATAS